MGLRIDTNPTRVKEQNLFVAHSVVSIYVSDYNDHLRVLFFWYHTKQ